MQIVVCDDGRELSEQGFLLKTRESVVRISFSGLEYVEVINKTVSFHLTDGVIHEVTAALADFEEDLLSRPEFFKAHRSYLINLNYIQAIDSDGVLTENGHRIPVSRHRRSQLQETYIQFHQQAGRAVPSSGKSEQPDGPWRILLVDDSPSDRTRWSDILRCHGCIVHLAENGENAVKMAKEENYDCVLLDVQIPGEDGFSICERLHGLVQAPIIFLSCVTEPEEQLKGFAAGGVDYITKDTLGELFWAKVETHIRLAGAGRTQLHYGPLLLDLKSRRALLCKKDLFLTPTEFDILQYLSEHAEHTFTPEEIFSMIWGDRPWDGGQMIQTHMSQLRRKLETAWNGHHFIETVWGAGYRFVPVRQ